MLIRNLPKDNTSVYSSVLGRVDDKRGKLSTTMKLDEVNTSANAVFKP